MEWHKRLELEARYYKRHGKLVQVRQLPYVPGRLTEMVLTFEDSYVVVFRRVLGDPERWIRSHRTERAIR